MHQLTKQQSKKVQKEYGRGVHILRNSKNLDEQEEYMVKAMSLEALDCFQPIRTPQVPVVCKEKLIYRTHKDSNYC